MFEKPSLPGPEKPFQKFPHLDSQISQSLEQIDFEELQGIFTSKVKELGIDPEKNIEKFVKDPKDIIKGRFRHAKASYDSSSGKIGIDEQDFKEFLESDDFKRAEDPSGSKRNYLLKSICHEETHAVGFQEVCNEGGLFNWSKKSLGGYSKKTAEVRAVVMVKIEILYSALNEAITERFSREVYIDYLKKKGIKSPERHFDYPAIGSYENEMFTLHEILHKIERECEIPSEYVWRVMLRGYFTGEDISGERMKWLFQNVFPEEFQKKLASWGGKKEEDSTTDDLNTIINESNWTDKDRRRIRRFISSLYNKMPTSRLARNMYY